MKTAIALSIALVAGTAHAAGVQGFDISSYQGTVDFAGAYTSGARFVIIKVCHLASSPHHIIAKKTNITH